MGSSPLALIWPGSKVQGNGLEYPVAEGTGKWIEFHDDPREGAASFGEDRQAEPSSSLPRSNAFDGDGYDAVRSRRSGRESSEEADVMV